MGRCGRITKDMWKNMGWILIQEYSGPFLPMRQKRLRQCKDMRMQEIEILRNVLSKSRRGKTKNQRVRDKCDVGHVEAREEKRLSLIHI